MYILPTSITACGLYLLVYLVGRRVKYYQDFQAVSPTHTIPTAMPFSYTTANMHQEELGEPILDVVLEPGDLLYFPRGTYHQVA